MAASHAIGDGPEEDEGDIMVVGWFLLWWRRVAHPYHFIPRHPALHRCTFSVTKERQTFSVVATKSDAHVSMEGGCQRNAAAQLSFFDGGPK